MSRHYSEDDLTLYFYGEGRRRADVERHLESCDACRAVYREIASVLGMVDAPGMPERGDHYGLEVWQRIRHRLPEQDVPWWVVWFRQDRLAWVAAAAMVVAAAFVAGRMWERQPGPAAPTATATTADISRRILLASVADHLDRSERVLTDIMNAPARSNISMQQSWADDLLTTSRLYRQDAAAAGEQSIANVLDDLERSLLEIVHSPSEISAADLEQIRRRIDAAALLFKVRVMSDELRQRERAPGDGSQPRISTRKIS
jgi:hypothetical protein